MTREVILGAIEHYKYDQVKPFVESLNSTDYNGDIVLFVNDIDKETLDKLKEEGVRTIPYTKPKKEDRITMYRYFLYMDFLKENNQYDKVMLTDVRDVLFQANPMNFDRGLFCFLEEENIMDCKFNKEWMLRAFGLIRLMELGYKPISCAGITIGDYKPIMYYLHRMLYYISMCNFAEDLDQAFHNFLIHKKTVNCFIVDNCKIVATVGKLKEKDIKFKNGKMINKAGYVVPVIHQYDRIRYLFQRSWKL